MATKFKEKSNNERKWHLLDATNIPMGRLATKVCQLLTGKGKVSYLPYLDKGDHVVVININKITLTGNKREQMHYYSHSKYPGNLKTKSLNDIGLIEAFYRSVFGMLPPNKLRAGWLKRLHLYPDAEHPHQANLAGQK